jgi:hypothetical protein
MASSSKSASKRASAAKRTSEKSHIETADSKADEATANTPGSTALGAVDRVVRPGDPESHDAHPNDPSASEVAHAPASGTQRAEGGHPAGEYDITNPAKDAQGRPTGLAQPLTTDDVSTGTDNEALLAAHYALSGADREALMARAKEDSRLSDDDRQAALEGTQVGFVLEHTGPNAWRCHVTGTNRFGHGVTATEAIEAYVIGNQGSEIEEAARRFARQSAQAQQEIRDRDKAAADTLAGTTDPVEAAREAALKTAKADRKAERPAAGANSDGAERESARRAEGSKSSTSKRK